MKIEFSFLRRFVLAASVVILTGSTGWSSEPDFESLQRQFQQFSGARLVFYRSDLPPGRYHDILKPLDDGRKAKAAAICLAEVRKFPRGYFRDIGLKAIGVFSDCASKTGDGYRPYDKQLGGYRYFGTYNRTDAVAIAHYTDGQLELTFHHETFHHVDSTQNGKTESWLLSSDDAFYQGRFVRQETIRGAKDHRRRPGQVE